MKIADKIEFEMPAKYRSVSMGIVKANNIIQRNSSKLQNENLQRKRLNLMVKIIAARIRLDQDIVAMDMIIQMAKESIYFTQLAHKYTLGFDD